MTLQNDVLSKHMQMFGASTIPDNTNVIMILLQIEFDLQSKQSYQL